MSWQATKAVWENSTQTGYGKLLMLALAEFADKDGRCWPAIETLAKRIDVKPRSIKRLVAQAESDGELIVDRNTGRGHTNEYTITYIAKGDTPVTFIEEIKGDTSAQKGDPTGTKGDTSAQKGDTPVTQNHQEPSRTIREPAVVTAANDSAIVFYENNIGGLSPKISELIYAAIDEHTETVVVEAMEEAVTNNVRRWNYISAILENWKQNGRVKHFKNGANGRPQSSRPVPAPASERTPGAY